jgi:hypothetical protein
MSIQGPDGLHSIAVQRVGVRALSLTYREALFGLSGSLHGCQPHATIEIRYTDLISSVRR